MPKKPLRVSDMPRGFCTETVEKIKRIQSSDGVIGVLHMENDSLKMYTVQEATAYRLATKLPIMSSAAHRAVTELDIMNELVAYRIETKSIELLVTPGEGFTAVVITKVKKSRFKGKQKKKSWAK